MIELLGFEPELESLELDLIFEPAPSLKLAVQQEHSPQTSQFNFQVNTETDETNTAFCRKELI